MAIRSTLAATGSTDRPQNLELSGALGYVALITQIRGGYMDKIKRLLKTIMVTEGISLLQARLVLNDLINEAVDQIRKENELVIEV